MKVGFENILLDLLGVGLMALGSYGVSQLYTITPFDKSWSKEKNTLYFCGIPVLIYLVFRVYFGISFYITSKIPSKYPFVGEFFISLFLQWVTCSVQRNSVALY